jgi:hypothetical protein
MPDWMTDSFTLIILGLGCFVFGSWFAWMWYRQQILVLKARQSPDKWETPKDFRDRTGSSLPGEAAVYCRWKKDGPMYGKLKDLHERNITSDPDTWIVHTHSMALSLGSAHGEQMEILCANSDLGCPPRRAGVR